jgi:valyl-tRNA synthetase
MPELDKTYTPSEVEARWYQRWLDDKCFQADPARVSEKRPAYSIVIPPPNVTGILTLGHVLNNTIQDILARRARMLGKEVLWLPGTDHAGIATQNVVEKTLKKNGEIKHRDDLGREKLVEKIWEWKVKHGGIIIQQLKKLGASCDWSRERFTMDPEYSRCVQRVFVDLYKKGLIYRGKRMVNWCPSSLTALSDEEVTMKPQNAVMYYFKVEVIEDTVPEARPWAIDISPQDEDTARHEHTQRNRRTGRDTYITGRRFDDRAGAALSAANRRRLGQAHAFLGELARHRESSASGGDTGSEFWTLRSAALRCGLPVLNLPDLGIVRDRFGALMPAGSDLKRLPMGSEAQPFLDVGEGVVLKVFAMHDDRFVGRGLDVVREDGCRWLVSNAPSSFMQALEKIQFLHEIGGLPTEIVGITPQGYLLLMQPQAEKISREEHPTALAEAVANAKGVLLVGGDSLSLAHVAVVWHRGRAWLIGDMHAQNIMRDSEGKARIMDALICPLPPHMERDLPQVAEAVTKARALVGLPPLTRLTIATTRPEVIPGDQAIAVNPNDPRYAHLIGKHVRRPLPVENQEPLPIIGDEHVDFEFGTGVLKVTPAHDKADFEIAQRHNLPAVDVMHPNGVLNELAGKDLAGMERFAARKRAAELLAEIGSLVKEEPYQNNIGYSERADVPIESRLSEQWFLKYPSTQPSQDVVAKGDMRFFPERWAKVYDHWMGGLQDWCISRQLWWGHRVPVWYKKGSDRSVLSAESVHCDTEPPAHSENWEQDPDVLDTWFSSWLWPFATMGWPSETADLKAFYPTTDLVTGPDIIFFWVARMIMAGYEYMGEMPFKNVYFTGIIRDKQGRKMSKSLGNSPDPLELIAKYSADALRFGIMRSAPMGQDILFDEKNVELGRNFCTKLWNAARFRQMQTAGGTGVSPVSVAEGVSPSVIEAEINPTLLTSDDKWILLRLNTAISEVTAALEDYRFSDATQTLYRFFWTEYCDWYIEASKATLQGTTAQNTAWGTGVSPVASSELVASGETPVPHTPPSRKANTLAVIDFVLGHTLRLFHPFLPFITEELWHGMGFNTDMPETQGGKSIMFAPWPKPLDADELAYFGILPEDEQTANDKYKTVELGRGLKSTFNINKKVRFVLKPAQELPTHEIEVLRILLNAEPLEVDATFAPKKGTPAAITPLGELFLPLDGIIDVEAERTRVTKEMSKVESELTKVRAKLADENFTSKVPQKVLDEHTQRQADWSTQFDKLKAMLEALG